MSSAGPITSKPYSIFQHLFYLFVHPPIPSQYFYFFTQQEKCRGPPSHPNEGRNRSYYGGDLWANRFPERRRRRMAGDIRAWLPCLIARWRGEEGTWKKGRKGGRSEIEGGRREMKGIDVELNQSSRSLARPIYVTRCSLEIQSK